MPDLYFYLYKTTQPDLVWRSKEAPTKSTILAQRNDESLPAAERKLYKKLYDDLEMSEIDANNDYLDRYHDVKAAHENPKSWLHPNNGGDVHYHDWGYEERRVWATPFNLPTKEKLVGLYTDAQFNPNSTSLLDQYSEPTEQYFPMKKYKQTYQRLGFIYNYQ